MKYIPILGLSKEGTLIPLFELLEFSFKVDFVTFVVNLLKGVGIIPQDQMKNVLNIIKIA